MAPVKSPMRFLSLLLVLSAALPSVAQTALPDAPLPEHASDTSHPFATTKWYGVVDPGEKIPRLRTQDKMMFWLHEEVTPTSLLPAFISAGYGQLTGFDPKYGNDSRPNGPLSSRILQNTALATTDRDAGRELSV